MEHRILSLIGMPSTGKSTVAQSLASELSYSALDLDAMVERDEQRSLIEILEQHGAAYFLNKEYGYLEDLDLNKPVIIATPGSLIYHAEMVRWTLQNTYPILLTTELDILSARLEQTPKAVVGLQEKGLAKLYEERMPLYREIASLEIDTANKSPLAIAQEIIDTLQQ